ncbi:unnamed protein product [Thelazia callipaeda]|uniref:Glycine N-acyltransferase-like protein n=1 Tax=Thelazia callipaeda TaxID=103827 RepID=A0A0N5D820_THECL|nr:unnamed protein product [Thelazia callipaeda]
MLKVFQTSEDLEEAELLTNDSVYLLPIHYSIRHERLGIFPEAKCTVLGYPVETPFIWMVIRRNKFTRAHVFAGSRTQHFLAVNDIDTFLTHAMPYLLELDQFAARILGIHLSSRMSEVLSTHFDFSAASYLSNFFIVEKHKQKQVVEMNIKLAEGYSFVELDPERDADIVATCWKFSTFGERDQFKAKIRRLPSVGVQSDDGRLASFTVLDASGFFNNQYTFVEHRQRGLADRSELKLCQKVILFGLCPMKFVEHDNTAVLDRSSRSQWWSTVSDETGNPIINVHRIVYRKNGIPLIV